MNSCQVSGRPGKQYLALRTEIIIAERASQSWDTAHFSQPSFSESAPAPMSGGADPVTGPSTAYGYNVNYNPNNSIQSATDTINGNWAYTYDDFNRLKTANQTNSNNALILAMNWGYDRFGNRMNQSATVGNPPQPGCAFDANNHFVSGCGITYDAAGDVLFDGSHTYTYDGENRILSVDNGAARYTYDAEGRRVRKQSAAGTVDYILDLAGRTVSEVAANGTFNRGEVYVGGRHLATYNNGTTYFIHADWLGTERARSDANAVMIETCANLPFGDLQQCTGSDPSPNHFTGKQRDTETNLDDFGARYFSSQYGRWMSPDWSAAPVPIPYANMGNPQSLNLYAYVNNDPITGEDADGHERFEQESQGDPQQHFYYTGVSSKTIDDDEGPDFSQADAPDSFWEAQKEEPTPNVPQTVKTAIASSVKASNAPTADDKEGGFHEEGGLWGTTTSGSTVVVPAKPGPYSSPTDTTAHIDPSNSVDPSSKNNMKSLDGTWHVHPKGGGNRAFVQPPSDKDRANAVAPVNIVVGAGNKRVYFYTSSGVVREMSLKDFMRGSK